LFSNKSKIEKEICKNNQNEKLATKIQTNHTLANGSCTLSDVPH
jgi:hypothetical protein